MLTLFIIHFDIDIECLRMTSMTLRSPEQQKAVEDTAKFSRENVGRSKALGPPDTKLFASGLLALTAQLKSHPQWYTMKAGWEEKVKGAQQDLVSLLQAGRYIELYGVMHRFHMEFI